MNGDEELFPLDDDSLIFSYFDTIEEFHINVQDTEKLLFVRWACVKGDKKYAGPKIKKISQVPIWATHVYWADDD